MVVGTSEGLKYVVSLTRHSGEPELFEESHCAAVSEVSFAPPGSFGADEGGGAHSLLFIPHRVFYARALDSSCFSSALSNSLTVWSFGPFFCPSIGPSIGPFICFFYLPPPVNETRVLKPPLKSLLFFDSEYAGEAE